MDDEKPKWRETVQFFEGRCPLELRDQFIKLRAKKEGFWTREEDIRLMVGYQTFGKNWRKIEELFRNKPNPRTERQIRERFIYRLGDLIPDKSWTEEDNNLLLELAKMHK
jgi:hypothetical protein